MASWSMTAVVLLVSELSAKSGGYGSTMLCKNYNVVVVPIYIERLYGRYAMVAMLKILLLKQLFHLH